MLLFIFINVKSLKKRKLYVNMGRYVIYDKKSSKVLNSIY